MVVMPIVAFLGTWIALAVTQDSVSPEDARLPLLLAERHRMLPADPSISRDVVFLDADQDGDQDAFVACLGFDRLRFNNGGGRFVDVSDRLPPHFEATLGVAAGDIDHDGDTDLVLAVDGLNRLLLNRGDGSFLDASNQLPAGSQETTTALLADVDGDGDLDLFFGNHGSTQNALALNNGFGVFSNASHQLPPSGRSTVCAAFGDAEGDGDLDLFVGNDSFQDAELFLNDGSGQFSDASAQIPKLEMVSGLGLGDFDGDGDLDVLLAVMNSVFAGKENALWRNDGNGLFEDASERIPSTKEVTTDIVVADLDNDGDLDGYLVNHRDCDIFAGCDGGSGGTDLLYRNDGSANFSVELLPFDESLDLAADLADVDGDGDLDAMIVAGGNSTTEEDRLLLGNGEGEFLDVTVFPRLPEVDPVNAVTLGDVNGDGLADALIAAIGQNRLWINQSPGPFLDATDTLPTDRSITHDIALGDVDGNGSVDLLVANHQQPNQLYLQHNGVFQDASEQIPADVAGSRVAVLADVDKDGDLDALFGNDASDPLLLYLNDGNGQFNDASHQVAAPARSTHAIVAEDLDGDGNLDLLLGNFGQNQLLQGDGTGAFIDTSHHLPESSALTNDIEAADLNGDGSLDLMSVNQGQDELALNDGTGVFLDATAQLPLDPGPDFLAELEFLDVNDDRVLDALVTNNEETRLLLNDGNANFVTIHEFLPPGIDGIQGMDSADLDGDGDRDVLLGTRNDRARMLYSAPRSLQWHVLPGLGRPLRLDVTGSRNSLVLVGYSLDLAVVPLPAGLLRLDPATLGFLTVVAIGPQGVGSWQVLLPKDDDLVGTTLFVQGLSLTDRQLTNAEQITLSAY